MLRRVVCIALPEIRLEIAAGAEKARERGVSPGPSKRDGILAVVVARPGGKLRTERDVLGATKLDVVSRAARESGVRAGQTVAAARAKCSELRVCVVLEDEVRTALERVAEAALAFGPSVALDVARDVVWVEVGGCAHLHGGERGLASAIDAKVRAMGHVCRVAIADGPCIASAVARFGAAKKRGSAPMIVPEGKGADAMRVLPVGVLALDDDTMEWLEGLGLRTCGALQKLPRRALGTRLGSRAHEVMQLLDGEDRAPLEPWRPPEVPEERVDLEWGASSIDALAFVVKALCDRIAVRLEGRSATAARLELVLVLDRALLGQRGSAEDARRTLALALPSPIARASDLCAVVRARLERESLAAPALSVTLRVPELSSSSGRTLDLLTPEPKAERALPRLVAELSAELGEASVGTLELADTWNVDRRTRLLRFGAPRATCHRSLVTSSLEPSRIVVRWAVPWTVPPSALEGAEHLARIEGVEWWHDGSPSLSSSRSSRRDGAAHSPSRRDWLAAWVHSDSSSGPKPKEGAVHALAWVELTDRYTMGYPESVPTMAALGGSGGVELPPNETDERSGRHFRPDLGTIRGWID
jgi:protein ImuB